MFKNHIKIAWRNISKDRMFTTIKIGGFAIGIAACILIFLFIRDEVSYDTHNGKKDRVYRVISEIIFNGEKAQHVFFPAPFAQALTNDYPEIEKSGRFLKHELLSPVGKELRIKDQLKSTFEEEFVYIDPSLLEILDVPLVLGSRENALKSPNSIVISKRKADKYFPEGDALGKQIILDNDIDNPYTIGGVMGEIVSNSHFNYDFLITKANHDFWEGESNDWLASNYANYVLLKPGTNVAELETKLMQTFDKYAVPALQGNASEAEIKEMRDSSRFILQPVTDIHLRSVNIHDNLSHSDIRFVWLFGGIAIFILILACINFINLSTAKSANRAKEVGLRKTVGAFKRNLVTQFLIESIIFSCISFGIGVLLTWLLLPYFNEIAAKNLFMPWETIWFIPSILIAALGVGILAGLYPSFYLSAFKPVDVLKGSLSLGSKSGNLRSGLVVFQFSVSVILLIGTLVIYRQMDYILNEELGYEKENVMVLKGTNTLGEKVTTLKKELQSLSGVTHVSIGDYLPITETKRNGNSFWKDGQVGENKGVAGQIWQVDEDYIQTLGMKLVEGRDFSKDLASDVENGAVINQKMVDHLGLTDPVGQKITNGGRTLKVIGVLQNFHFDSLKEDIMPLCLVMGNSASIVTARIHAGNSGDVIASVKTIWDKLSPNQNLRYTFLDQRFAVMHEDIRRLGIIFNSFALFALFVACLGLFALSAFMVEQRNKEISIRMVLGASHFTIYKLLSKDFLKLVAISIVIASPIAWYIMNRWLEDFAYKISINWQVFALCALLVTIIAIFTVSYQSIHATFIKPLRSLRTE
ncbi:ABC transporter permease [Aquimarina sp. D1M17]|uniref:ABC transporter permease n=1 Tax=Aquimarina acroporae TaxID=2937283 RepID=UPI0020C16F37|nr:ABC transporter permease [Aquimarina acroporae]MCK8523162.1 ABC transporter permease [Aquimarina acroporae]